MMILCREIVLSVGARVRTIRGVGGRRQRKRRRSAERFGAMVWLRSQRRSRGPEYPFGDERDIPF